MLPKALVSCVLIIAIQAGYSAPSYDNHKAKPSLAGYAAQIQPVATLTILPDYGSCYSGSVNAYGSAPVYEASQASRNYTSSASSYRTSQSSAYTELDAEILNLLKLVFALPSAGAPDPNLINVPQYPASVYAAPVVEVSSNECSNDVSSSSAAVAATNIKSASSGYGPAPVSAVDQYAGSGPSPGAFQAAN